MILTFFLQGLHTLLNRCVENTPILIVNLAEATEIVLKIFFPLKKYHQPTYTEIEEHSTNV